MKTILRSFEEYPHPAIKVLINCSHVLEDLLTCFHYLLHYSAFLLHHSSSLAHFRSLGLPFGTILFENDRKCKLHVKKAWHVLNTVQLHMLAFFQGCHQLGAHRKSIPLSRKPGKGQSNPKSLARATLQQRYKYKITKAIPIKTTCAASLVHKINYM